METSNHKRTGLIVLGAVLISCGLLAFFLNRHITLVLDGQKTSLSTYAFQVNGLLASRNIALSPQDEVQPPTGTWLRDGMVITVTHAVPVQIYADGELHQLLSPHRLPANLLAEAGVALKPGDMLISEGLPVSLNTPLSEPIQAISLQVLRSLPFTLYEGTQAQAFSSLLAGLGQSLWKSGVVLQVADNLQPAADTPLTQDVQARLQRAAPVTIQSASGDLIILTAARTVGEALTEAGLSLQGLDYSNPPAEKPIPADREIHVVRVSEEVIIENTPLAFETAYEPDPELELDSQSLLQAGEYGLTAQRVRVRYEDGQEVSRQVEAEWIARQPKTRIIGYGTKVVKRSVDTADGRIDYYRALTMWATSYSPASVGGSTTTASGKTLRKGLVGINYYYIPFGTMMYVPGYGYAEAADTGNIGPRWIDLGYTDDDYVAWHQYVTVYFLWPPPAQILWMYP